MRGGLSGAGLIVLAVIAYMALSVTPSPYYLMGPGGSYEVGPRLHVPEEERHETGRLAFTAVLARPGSWIDVLRGWVSDDAEVIPAERVRPPGVTDQEVAERNRRLIEESKIVAAVVGLSAAGYEAAVTGQGAEVAGILEDMPAAEVLQVGDIIFSVDGEPTDTAPAVVEAIRRHEVGDTVRLGVLRDGERIEAVSETAASPTEPDRPLVGAAISTYQFDATLPFPVEIDTQNIGGSSAGLMFALGILDATTEGVLTRGHFVAGTGTISVDGSVGPIGGAQWKVISAEQDGASVFLVPTANFEEAAGAASTVRVVQVDTFEDAVRTLCGLQPTGEAAPTAPPPCQAYLAQGT